MTITCCGNQQSFVELKNPLLQIHQNYYKKLIEIVKNVFRMFNKQVMHVALIRFLHIT